MSEEAAAGTGANASVPTAADAALSAGSSGTAPAATASAGAAAGHEVRVGVSVDATPAGGTDNAGSGTAVAVAPPPAPAPDAAAAAAATPVPGSDEEGTPVTGGTAPPAVPPQPAPASVGAVDDAAVAGGGDGAAGEPEAATDGTSSLAAASADAAAARDAGASAPVGDDDANTGAGSASGSDASTTVDAGAAVSAGAGAGVAGSSSSSAGGAFAPVSPARSGASSGHMACPAELQRRRSSNASAGPAGLPPVPAGGKRSRRPELTIRSPDSIAPADQAAMLMTPMTRITNMSASPLLESPRFIEQQAKFTEEESKTGSSGAAPAGTQAASTPGGSAVQGGAAAGSSARRRSSGTRRSRGKVSLSPADFLFGPVLGEGAYARVLRCRMKRTKLDYAIKVMLMSFIQKEKKVPFVLTEKRIQSGLNHPNIVKLKYAFKDSQYLFMVLDLCATELLGVIRTHRQRNTAKGVKDKALSLPAARWYVTQIVNALEYLHLEKHVVHRDLKPENILVTAEGHVQITDFGTAKDKHVSKEQLTAFVGTAEYVSPEVLEDEEATRGVDLWALGCITFQLLVGRPPFSGGSEYLTFQQIMHYPDEHSLDYPADFPKEARDFIEALLVKDVTARLGCGEDGAAAYAKLKAHPFFWEGDDAFATIAALNPPYLPPKQPEVKFVDGATSDWDSAGDFTVMPLTARERSVREIFIEGDRLHSPPPAGSRRGSGGAMGLLAAGSGSGQAMPGTSPPEALRSETAYWSSHLDAGECVVHSGLVEKRVGFFSRKRQLLLTSKPRLIYFDPVKYVYKGEIPWGPTLKVKVKDKRVFDVAVPGRVYHLTAVLGTAAVWQRAIEKLMAATTPAAAT